MKQNYYRTHKKNVVVKGDQIVVQSTQGTREIYDLTEQNSEKIYKEVLGQYPEDIEKYALASEKKDILGNYCTGSVSMLTCCIAAGISHDIPSTLLSTLLALMTSARLTYMAKESRKEKLELLYSMKNYIEGEMTTDWAIKKQTLLLPNEVVTNSDKVKKLFRNDAFFKQMGKTK